MFSFEEKRTGKGALARNSRIRTLVFKDSTIDEQRAFIESVKQIPPQNHDLKKALLAIEKLADAIVDNERAASELKAEANETKLWINSIGNFVAKNKATSAAYIGVLLGCSYMRMRIRMEKKFAAQKKDKSNAETKKKARELAREFRQIKPKERIGEGVGFVQAGLKDKGFKKYSDKTIRKWIADLFPPELRRSGAPRKDK